MLSFFKKLFLLFVFSPFMGEHEGFCQNLVPNPSFEDTVSCPNSGGQVSKAKYWYSLLNSPDYLNACCVYPQYNVPSNTFGYQNAHTGNAYMGMWSYSSSAPTYREIIGTFLKSPLIIGQKYFVTFKANCAFNFPIYGTNTACNKLGILFSTTDYLSAAPPINNFSHIYTDSILSDTLNWVTIRGSFIADSAYTFISIGNFFDNAHTDTLHLANSNSYQAYIYLDDFCISDDSLYSEVWTSLSEPVLKGDILIFPNPASENIAIKNIALDFDEVDIYNIEGKRLMTFKIMKNNDLNFDVSNLNTGIYSLVFIRKKNIQIKKFIKI